MKLFHKILLAIFTISLLHTSLFAQWVQQPLPVNKPITGIKFINSQTGWACTSQGGDTAYIISTNNSGANWYVQVSAYNIYFTDIDFVDSQNGFAASYDNNIGLDRLYKTSNGGLNWTSIVMIPNMYLKDIQFINKDSAWESGGILGPDVRTTTDGGNSWQVRTTGLSQQSNKIFFINYNTGFCGSDFFLHKTTNAGLSWSLIGGFGEQIYGIYFQDLNSGWVTLSGHKIASTTNGGVNWTTQNPFARSENIYDITFFNNIGYAATGWTGRILKTTNTGLNWGYQLVPIGSINFSFTDTLNGWCGEFAMSHTTNGGGNITYSGLEQISNEIPLKYKMHQNYPNPFNPVTAIKVDLPFSSNINLVICDILGRELYQISNEYLKAGSYSFTWDASKYASGIYFYRLDVYNSVNIMFSECRKMILLK